ncbi:MAG: heparinase II/III family protein [Paracoccaceae bacterium]
MSTPQGFSAHMTRTLNRWSAGRATRGSSVTAFRTAPEPRTIGSFARGRQLLAGNYLFAGHLVQGPNSMLWDIDVRDATWIEETQGFSWLDDLAAVGDMNTRALGQSWVWGWIDRYGRGSGPGWTPDLTGRRLIRWINHALFLLRGQDAPISDLFYRSLGHQTVFLSKRWHATAPGLPRFEALTGLIYAALALEGMDHLAEPAITALAKECDSQVGGQGGLPTRNPEELLDVFTLLTWGAAALSDAGKTTPDSHLKAIERIAPTLRTLRHSDGGLARFHGGGRGLEGWLDHALAASGVKARQPDGLSMGYARLSAGRTSIIVDAAKPPSGKASSNGHASTLAFELTSGRRPLIVNCGSGVRFGPDWRRAGRATPSHSVLCLDGFSSSRLGSSDKDSSRELLTEAPDQVPIEVSQAPDGLRFQGGHDGYAKTHGLTQARTLELTFDGRGLVGEDLLLAIEDSQKRRFEVAMNERRLAGIPFDIRFHLHPEVDAAVDMGGTVISMALKSGEIWIFRHDGTQRLSLEPSVFLEQRRLKPRASQQIVLTGRATQFATRVRWSLSKAQETAIGVRDLRPDDEPSNDDGTR